MTRRVVFALAMFLLTPTLVLGQAETTGRISGRVVDEDGHAIEGARVTLISSALQGERVMRTDREGRFLAALLPVGPYAVSVASPGRQTVQVSLRLGVAQTVPLEIRLRFGEGLVDVITVHGTATPLETTVGGENFNYEKTLEELPVSRVVGDVPLLVENVHEGAGVPESLVGTDGGFAISGAPAFDTVALLDGVEISLQWGSGLALYLEDAIEEVQVMTSGIPARYGRFQGGVVNAITKTGGNEFDGVVRAEFSKQSWDSRTPFGEEQSDDVNQAYQATLGGYILKDKLWLFAGARVVPTESQIFTTVLTRERVQHETDEDRWQIKLRGAPSPDHAIEASYLDRDRIDTGVGSGAGDLGSAMQGAEERFSLLTLGYQGVLGSRRFLEFRASRRDGSTFCCGNSEPVPYFWDVVNNIMYNNGLLNPTAERIRDNETAALSFTNVFEGTDHGSHTFEAGLQWVSTTFAGALPLAEAGGLVAIPLGATPFAVLDVQTGEPRYNLNTLLDGGDMLLQRGEDLHADGLEDVLDNYALYAQDAWQLGKWRIDAGLRWETYDLSTRRSDIDPDLDTLAPRLGVTRNFGPSWQVQATWGRYAARFYEILSGNLTGVLGIPRVARRYTGPALLGLSAAEVAAIVGDDSQWGVVLDVQDPDQPKTFLADDVELPHADELTVGLRGALPRNSGSFTLTYINRDYEQLLDDFVGDFGDQLIVDPVTGEPPTNPATGGPLRFDNIIWDNASTAVRRYQGIAATWDYRPTADWNVGGNWTYSELTGNYEGDNSVAGLLAPSAIGTYERSRPEEAAVRSGYLGDDVRHRFQAWSNYRFDLERAGALSLGALGRYQSGRNWSRTATLPLQNDPVYNNDTGSYTHFFDGRGNNHFDDWWTLDLSARWQFQIFKRMNGWLKATVINVFDNDALIAYDTSGFAMDDGTGNLSWQSLGNCGPSDAPSVDCTGFGRIRNQSDYQTPRSYLFTVGLSF